MSKKVMIMRNILKESDALKIVENFISENKITDEDLCQELYVTAIEKIGSTYAPSELVKKLTKRTEKFYHTKIEKLHHVSYISDLNQQTSIDTFKEIADSATDKELLQLSLSLLNPVEMNIIANFFGFVDDPKSLTEIGSEMGITGARVSQIKNRALRKMRKEVELHQWKERKVK